MLKLYKWLATGHLGFLKVFGHFYKMLWYFYQGKTKGQKIKQRRNRKGELLASSPTSLPLARLAQPSPYPLSSSSPSPRSCSLEARGRAPTATATPAAF